MSDRQQKLIAQESRRSGLRGKINAKCVECVYDDIGGGGTWREQVEACTAVSCPLFSVRPVSRPETRVRVRN
jgi:hypothetical protein